jgi:hypothetical protein
MEEKSWLMTELKITGMKATRDMWIRAKATLNVTTPMSTWVVTSAWMFKDR